MSRLRQASGMLVESARTQLANSRKGARMTEADHALALKQLDTMASIFESAPDVARSTRDIFVSAAEAWRLTVELEASIRRLELDYSARIERARLAAPIVEKTLDGMSARADKILDTVLSIDTRTCEREDLALRGDLISIVRELNLHIVSTLTAFLRG